MDRTVSATKARTGLGALMDWVRNTGEPVVIEHSGEPHAVLLSVDSYQRLVAGLAQESDWRTLVQQARELIREELGERQLPPPEDVIRDMREERDAQLFDLR
jgi:prevent-host-death family protein